MCSILSKAYNCQLMIARWFFRKREREREREREGGGGEETSQLDRAHPNGHPTLRAK